MIKYIFLMLSLCVAFTAGSANNSTIVKHYSTENGLTHNTVKCAIKDEDGFMWFGTWYGISSFDGEKFTRYNIRNEFSMDIPPRKVQDIIDGNNHTLWVKTIDHKLYLFDKKSECFTPVFNEIKKKYPVSSQIIKIERMEDGSVLMLTQNKDLLIGNVNDERQLEINLLYDSHNQQRGKNVKNNVLFENYDFLGWIGSDYKILCCEKGPDLIGKPADFLSRKITGNQAVKFTCAHFSMRELWLGDEDGNIYKVKMHNGNAEKLAIPGVRGVIENIVAVNKELVYISVVGKGIYEYDVKKNNYRKVLSLQSGESVVNSFSDSYDKVWLDIDHSSLIFFDTFEKTSKRFQMPKGKINESIFVCDGQDQGMFFLTTSGESYLYDRNDGEMAEIKSKVFNKHDSDSSRFYNIMLDKEGILWLSSVDNGVFRYSFPPRQFSNLEINEMGWSRMPSVKSMYKSRSGDLWLGFRSGDVVRLDEKLKIKNVYNHATQHIGSVYHFMEDRSGNMWFSTKGNGLIKAIPDPGSKHGYRFTRYSYSAGNQYSINGNDVYYTYQDDKGRIWVALFGGGLNLMTEHAGDVRFLHKYNTFRNYPEYGLYMEVRNITQDESGRMWVGTTDGLLSFAGNFSEPSEIAFETWRDDRTGSNVTDNDIYVLYKDSSSNIWFSAFGGGLTLLKGYDELSGKPLIEGFMMKEGLSSDVILSIQEDENDNLWLATESGLCCFDKLNFSFRSFDQYDGLPFIKMEETCAVQTDSGLLFGHKYGVIGFMPENIDIKRKSYPTYIVGMKVSNKPLLAFDNDPIITESMKYVKELTLDHFQSMFDIEFAALNFYNQNRVNYKYILEGYEKEWHSNGLYRYASYTNVPPGEYLFRVQTTDESDPEMLSEASLKIIILPPWWRSTLAYIIYVILALLAGFGIVRIVLFLMKMKNDVYIAQKLSELKIRFFTNISHELRTPLTLIKGPIQELRNKENLSEKGLQYVNLMEKNTEHMLQLVNQILDFRKIQNGKMKLHVSRLDLNKVVNSLQREFTVLAEEHEISYNLQADEEEILMWADHEKLETVIRNILSNAFKFTPSGGSIHVSTGLTDNSTRCYVRVEDTGVGIPQEKLADIFDRFAQADNAKNKYYQGTGIGLALSKEIISLHHGEITVESNDGNGSVFTIILNVDKEHFRESEVDFYVGNEVEVADVAEADAAMAGDDADISVDNSLPVLLLVEDNKDLCSLIRMQMEDRFNVFVASNGEEGLRKIHVCHPDIVVTDLMMPEMDGLQMLKRIRSDFQISHIPVIILTAKYGEDAKTRAISLGANAYITKPFSKEYLEARIDQLLNERKHFRDNILQYDKSEDTVEKDEYGQYLDRKDVEFLDKIHNIIEENMVNSDFNIDTIASTIGLSRSAFFKKLKGLTGLAPVELARDIRLSKSIELIKTTDLTISEIAYSVGFKDSGYYSKCFRKKYNQTPREFISENRKSTDYKTNN